MLPTLKAHDVFVFCCKVWEDARGGNLKPLEFVCLGLVELVF